MLSIVCFSQSIITIDTIYQSEEIIHLAKVKAWDPDGDEIKYLIEEQEFEDLFMIEKPTGWLYIKIEDLKFVIEKQEHQMIICVSDFEYTSCNIVKLTLKQPTTINAYKGGFGRPINQTE